MYRLLVAPTSARTGLTSICLGLVRAFDQQGVRVGFFKPFSENNNDVSGSLLQATQGIELSKTISLVEAQRLVSQGDIDNLMEMVVRNFREASKGFDVVVIEGLVPENNQAFVGELNTAVAKTIDADVLLVASAKTKNPEEVSRSLQVCASYFGGLDNNKVIGAVINQVGAIPLALPIDDGPTVAPALQSNQFNVEKIRAFNHMGFKLVSKVHYDPNFTALRTKDIAKQLNAEVIYEGELSERRVNRISICARTVPNLMHTMEPGALLVTPGDRDDVLMAASLTALKGVPLAGIMFTGGLHPNNDIMTLCERAFNTGLPVLISKDNSFETAKQLDQLDYQVPVDDPERINCVMDGIASTFDMEYLLSRVNLKQQPRLSPAAFRYNLVSLAQANRKRVVLPEGEEPRTIQAAILCHEKQMADCILLGDREIITNIASNFGMEVPDDLTILDPAQVRHSYVGPMVKLREHKGLTEPMALSQLEDNVVLGTMMLATDEVDGLVSGAIHTTANTIRPALQLIKTKPDASLVSSVFFMCLPDQVLVYGDCAVNPDPNAQQLCDIALQSAQSAQAFGIDPKVAMISYSTGASGMGSDVEKVRTATQLAQTARPDLLIDGPMQYDAATVANVAKSKAPNSKVAGQATVFVFPDLNTGNTTYKAVQRSANCISVGPMLQGLAKPVNDLSRGALVEDILYTIALTAIQAQQQ